MTFFVKPCRCWCARRDSNPYALRRRNLNPGCLPIPPPAHCLFVPGQFITGAVLTREARDVLMLVSRLGAAIATLLVPHVFSSPDYAVEAAAGAACLRSHLNMALSDNNILTSASGQQRRTSGYKHECIFHSSGPLINDWSVWQDLNLRPPAPQAGALTRLRYTPSHTPPPSKGRAVSSPKFKTEAPWHP